MKKWVLFDLDGTLTDPMIGITSGVKYALSKFGIDVPYLKELTPFIGPPLKASFMDFYGFSKEDTEEAIRYYREYYGPKGLYENEVYPGIKEMLVHLEQAGFDLAVASSKPTEYVEQILRHFGLKEHFIVVMGSEFDGRRTDKAEVIRYVLRRAQVRPAEVIMVGDRKHDILGAKECNVETIGVTYGYGSRKELEEYGADHVVDSVAELEQEIFQILKEEQKESRRLMSWSRNEKAAEAVAFGGTVPFAMIGTGAKAEKFYQANRFGRQFELVAVCGETMEKALAFAGGKGPLMCFEDLDELASWEVPAAVYISCEIGDRFAASMKMLCAGKHVLVEAPMAFRVKEAEEMFRMAREHNVMLMEAVPALYAPAWEKMLPYLKSLGTVCHATLQNCHYSVGYEQWKRGIVTEEFNPEIGGSSLYSMGVYPVSAMIRLFGEPKSVSAWGVTLANGMDVTGTILMGYDSMVGEAIYSKISDSSMPSQIQGEEGSMLLGEIWNIKDLRISRRKVDQSIHFEQSDNIMSHVTNAFIRMVHTGLGMEEGEKVSLATIKVLEEAAKQIR